MSRVIVTGATSLVGVALIDECVKNNVEVVALVRRNSGKCSRIPDSKLVTIVECGLDALDTLSLDLPCDVFYHFGWSHTDKNGRKDAVKQQENIRFSLSALQAAKRNGCQKFIGSGSQAEYGVHTSVPTGPDSPLYPQEAYGIAKAAAGKLCSIEAEKLGIDYAWVRIFSLYGKYELDSTLIQTTLKKMLADERCSFSPCTHIWDYLYSVDAGEAFFQLGEKLTGNKIYCLGSGEKRPLCEYLREMKAVLGSDSELGFGDIPYPSVKPTGFCADISLLESDIGWKPHTSFGDGILSEANRFIKERGSDK